MSSEAGKFVAHPSVRIKGSENCFYPVKCTDVHCSTESKHHIHCPFCPKSTSFQDSRIVKAHYRVKHVDKGIYFAGLKILRCCSTCDIVGAIKGEKKFKGAHWHCYKCRNGFNRRDEAVKHYRTHFRQPCTTFQIYIPQEVNDAMKIIGGDENSLNSTVSEDVISSTVSPGMASCATVTLDVASETTVADDAEDDSDKLLEVEEPLTPSSPPTTVMIIKEETPQPSPTITAISNTVEGEFIDQNIKLIRTISQLKLEFEELGNEKLKMEKSLKAEIAHLQLLLHNRTQEVEQLKKREQELHNQLNQATSLPNDGKLQQLLSSLQAQHTEMLQQHLLQVRNEAYQAAVKEIQNNTVFTATVDGTQNVVQENSVVAVVLDGHSLALPISVASSVGPTLMCCTQSKSLLQKSASVVIPNATTYSTAPTRTSQITATTSQPLLLTIADPSDASGEIISSGPQSSTTRIPCTIVSERLLTGTEIHYQSSNKTSQETAMEEN